MRHAKVAVSGTLVLLLSILTAGPVLSAAHFEYVVLTNECLYEPGTWDAGYALLDVKVTEAGKSGANYFRTRTFFQRQVGWDFPWREIADTGWQYSGTFANDSTTHSHTKRASYRFEEGDRWAQTRVLIRVQIWSTRLGLLSKQSFHSSRC